MAARSPGEGFSVSMATLSPSEPVGGSYSPGPTTQRRSLCCDWGAAGKAGLSEATEVPQAWAVSRVKTVSLNCPGPLLSGPQLAAFPALHSCCRTGGACGGLLPRAQPSRANSRSPALPFRTREYQN